MRRRHPHHETSPSQDIGLCTPSGPLSESCALELFGIPQSFPFQPSKPSILNNQKPVVMSLIMMSPSTLRTSIPQYAILLTKIRTASEASERDVYRDCSNCLLERRPVQPTLILYTMAYTDG